MRVLDASGHHPIRRSTFRRRFLARCERRGHVTSHLREAKYTQPRACEPAEHAVIVSVPMIVDAWETREACQHLEDG